MTNRNNSGAMLCPKCRRLMATDEAVCPHCGTPKPAGFLRNNPVSRAMDEPQLLIRAVIGINVAMYVLSLVLGSGAFRMTFNPLGLFSPDDKILLLLGATGTLPIQRFHWWWTLVTANYLHGGILHIFFNMMAFKQLAPFIIREYGGYRTIFIYTAGGVIGFWVSYLAGVRFTIGASAAVCALIGAALYYGKSRGGIYGQTVYRQVGGWAITLFVFGLLVPGINNWGHGGGMAAGALVAALVGYHERRRENRLHAMLGMAAVIVTVVILAYAVVSGLYYRFS